MSYLQTNNKWSREAWGNGPLGKMDSGTTADRDLAGGEPAVEAAGKWQAPAHLHATMTTHVRQKDSGAHPTTNSESWNMSAFWVNSGACGEPRQRMHAAGLTRHPPHS